MTTENIFKCRIHKSLIIIRVITTLIDFHLYNKVIGKALKTNIKVSYKLEDSVLSTNIQT